METAIVQKKSDVSAGFKSYYVVWKPVEREEEEEQRKSLNRTMQYGNARIRITTHFPKLRLNRTMQYGNDMLYELTKIETESLNRTMQYGNHNKPLQAIGAFQV